MPQRFTMWLREFGLRPTVYGWIELYCLAMLFVVGGIDVEAAPPRRHARMCLLGFPYLSSGGKRLRRRPPGPADADRHGAARSRTHTTHRHPPLRYVGWRDTLDEARAPRAPHPPSSPNPTGTRPHHTPTARRNTPPAEPPRTPGPRPTSWPAKTCNARRSWPARTWCRGGQLGEGLVLGVPPGGPAVGGRWPRFPGAAAYGTKCP